MREGTDFSSQADMRAQVSSGAVSGASRMLEGDHAAIRLVRRVLRDLQMFRQTGALPHGRAYSDQPAYMVELYRTVWGE